jgi:hypothetical protein
VTKLLEGGEIGKAARGTSSRQHGAQVDGVGDQRARNGNDGFLDELLEAA